MANSKGSKNIRNSMFAGKHALLPPKSPFPPVSPAYVDYIPIANDVIGSKLIQKSRDGSTRHHRTSSESHLIEEQPSWLDDLLNEPDTPVYRGGHRRSSSDSFAYVDDVCNGINLDHVAQDECRYKSMNFAPSWTRQDFDYYGQRDARVNSLHANVNLVRQKNRARDSSLNAVTHPSGLPFLQGNMFVPGLGSSRTPQEEETASEKQDSSETKDNPQAKSSSSDSDTKRAKQQFAQRSRVRKLQYIAELERNVQALQARVKGSEASAEIGFLNQRTLVLSMENKALKQRLESLAQEKAIKYLEQEVLEREIVRLRVIHQHHQQQQQQQQNQQQRQPSSHRRSSSKDLDSQFANLNLTQKDTSSCYDPVRSTQHLSS